MSRRLAASLALLAAACGQDERAVPLVPICDQLTEACAAAPAQGPAFSPPIQVAPSDSLPSEVESQRSHNNLDIAWFGGRLYFAFRTAPHHFAGLDTVLYVVSTEDQRSWRFETKVALDRDVREPRFLDVSGRLYLYFAVLGTNPLAFEPEGARVIERVGDAEWTAPEAIFDAGFIPWRARNIDEVGYLIGYTGGENIYQGTEPSVDVHFLKTHDGRSFEPVVADQPVVLKGGGSETDFAFLDDGALVAVSRNELGDEDRWGSKICRAEAGALGKWTCKPDPRKYDSPLVFRQGADVWLIGRRQLANDGNYDLFQTELSAEAQTSAYEAAYWKTPKRCSLWKVDPVALTVSFVLDLPSNGDTCFASAVPLRDKSFLVYNYTSPLDGEELSWLAGQQNPTLIYQLSLTVP
ncbi:MAG: hypothetical protein IPM35_06100 [Myxococcales bacterium]|nr:hypothetical protein [Myxococcales bacterium]